MAEKKKRKLALWGGGALLLVATGLAWGPARDWLHERSLSQARAAVHKCLLGTPLAEGETPSGRVRRIALGSDLGDWPQRCAPVLAQAKRAMMEEGEIDSGRFPLSSEDIFEVANGESSELDAFLRGPLAELPAEIPAAPPPAPIPNGDTPLLLPKANWVGSGVERVPSEGLTYSASFQLCRIDRDLASARCTDMKELREHKLHSRSVLSADPGVIPPLEGDKGVFRADGQQLCKAPCAAYAHADGTVTVYWRADGDRPWGRLRRQSPGDSGGASISLPWDNWAQVVDGQVLLFDGGVLKRAVSDGDGSVEELLEVPGMTSYGSVACRAKSQLVIADNDRKKLVFIPPSTSKAVVVDTGLQRAPEGMGGVDGAVGRLWCGEQVVFLTSVFKRFDSKGFSVAWAKCTPAGCSHGLLDLNKVMKGRSAAVRPAQYQGAARAAGLGDKLLVLWNSAAGGVRFRFGDPDKLRDAPEHVAFDDRYADGVITSSLLYHDAMLLESRHRGVVAILPKGGDGMWAVRIGLDGAVAPITPMAK